MSKIGLVEDLISFATKGAVKEVPKVAKPLYSSVNRAAVDLARNKGTGKEFMTELAKKPGVKQTEIKERGLNKIESMPKMTKEQFLDELDKRPAPQVEEKVLREPSKADVEQRAHEMAYEDAMDELRSEGMNRHEAEDIAAEMAEDRVDDYIERAREEFFETGDAPQHGDYTLPRGENYREMLLKVPSFKGDRKIMELEAMRRRVDPDTNPSRHKELTQQIDALKAEKAAFPEQFQGVQAHFAGEPGILASIRVSDRNIPTYTKKQAEEIGQRIAEGMNVADHKNLGNGSINVAIKQGLVTPKEAAQYADYRGFKDVDTTGAKQKVLHVEEIQSDWHQEGRKAGYGKQLREGWRFQPLENGEIAVYGPDMQNPYGVTARGSADPQADAFAIADKYGAVKTSTVPDAPFKKNWHELALKRVLNYAAENGYDSVAITPGVEQADRYNLAKHVDKVEVYKLDNGMYNLEVIDKNGKSVVIPDSRSVSPERITQIVGKDVAQKAISQADEAGQSTLSGLDLEVGGEGMKGFYDKMLPDYLNSYGKKYGVQVTPFDIETEPARIERAGVSAYQVPAKTSSLHGFDITPEMREEIKGKGLPLYQQIGIPAGGAAAGAEALEGQEEQGFAAGGAVTGPVGSEYDTDPDMEDGGRVIQSTAFKKGGRVKKRGQVKFASNPDTMWLELMSRS